MAENGAERKGDGRVTTAIVILMLSLMAAGVGFALGVFLQPAKEPVAPSTAQSSPDHAKPIAASDDKAMKSGSGQADHTTEENDDSPPAEEEPVALSGLKTVPIPPILTTLAEPEGKWIRLEGSILIKPTGEQPPELLAEKAGEQILAYLRTVRLEQIQGPSGLLALRDDLSETVRTLSGDQVQGLLIHGLLVE